MKGDSLVEIENLSVDFATAEGALHVLRDVSLSIGRSRVVGLVGESGSGKSTLALALLGLLPDNTGEVSGRIELDGENLLRRCRRKNCGRLRGGRIAMIFQDPMTALNPVFSMGARNWSMRAAQPPSALARRRELHEAGRARC